MNVLLVEDDPTIRRSVAQGFEEAGHACTQTATGTAGESSALEGSFDVIVLDLMLPERNGMEVLRSIRVAGVQTPVIVLTALSSVDDRVRGLEDGADDYLIKPFAFSELLARAQALHRRRTGPWSAVRTAGNLQVDVSTQRARIGEQTFELTPTECKLLELLVRNANQVVSRQMLLEHVWGFRWDGSTNVIEVHVNHLRKKLNRHGSKCNIETVRGRGYVLRAD